MTLPTNWKHKSVKDRKGFRLSPTTQSPCFETWCIFIYSIYQRPALAYQPFHLGEDVQRELLPIIWTTIHVETSSTQNMLSVLFLFVCNIRIRMDDHSSRNKLATQNMLSVLFLLSAIFESGIFTPEGTSGCSREVPALRITSLSGPRTMRRTSDEPRPRRASMLPHSMMPRGRRKCPFARSCARAAPERNFEHAGVGSWRGTATRVWPPRLVP